MLKERYELLDYLRGFFLFVIIVDHLALFPSVFEVFSLRGNAWVSAAEGFFFLSGLMVVIARFKRHDKDSMSAARRKLLNRSIKLALLHVFFTITFTVTARLVVEYGDFTMKTGLNTDTSTLDMIWQAITFRYAYGWTDFLGYYAAYLAAAIPLSWLLIRKKLAWLILPLGLIPVALVSRSGNMEYEMQWFVWWAYFAIGMVAGAYFTQLKKLSAWAVKRQWLLIGLAAVFVVTALTSYGLYMRFNDSGWAQWYWDWADRTLRTWTDRWLGYNRTGILRVPLFVLWMSLCAIAFHKYIHLLPTKIRGMLLLFGQNSLRNYILQGIIIFALPTLVSVPDNVWSNSIVSVAVIGLVYWLLKRPSIRKLIPN